MALSLNPRLGEGEDNIVRPPKPRPHGSAVEKDSLPRGVGSGPSGVLDVPDVPEGRLVHDATHLFQTLCLADPFQAHLWGPAREAEGPWWGSAAPAPSASPPRGKGQGPVDPGAPPPLTHGETRFKGRDEF